MEASQRMQGLVVSAGLFHIALLGAFSPAAAAQDNAETAVLNGVATYRGDAPKPREIKLADGAGVIDECELVSPKTGGIRNVFVWVKDAGKLGRTSDPPELQVEIKDRQFRPRIIGVLQGQKLAFVNGDDMPHSVDLRPRKSKEFSVHQPRKGNRDVTSFETPEFAIPITSGACKWMKAWLFVMEHSCFTVTDADGVFTLPPLAPGAYEVAAWHEVYGDLPPQKIAVKAKDNARLEFVVEKK